MKRNHRLGSAAALFAACLVPAIANAYVDVELDNGRHVVGESSKEEGSKLIVYRPIGAVEIDRATVRSIREISGGMPSDRQKTVEPSSLPAASSASASIASLGEASGGASRSQARAKEITAKLFEVYRFRAAAQNRGDQEAFAKLDNEAKSLVKERAELLQKAKSEKPEKPSAD